jgi:hypothetical protein
VSIEIGIVAHEQRYELLHKLIDSLEAVAVLNVDDGTLKCEGNHLHVLRQLLLIYRAGKYDWAIVLEDDAQPVADFEEQVTKALRFAPAPVVGFYLGNGAPGVPIQRTIRQAVVSAQAWITADCLIGSVGYAVRAELLYDMLGFITDRTEELPLRISRWVQARDLEVCYTQPSLVEHADEDSIGRPWRGPYYHTQAARRAWSYGTRDNWNTPAVRLGHCGIWSRA